MRNALFLVLVACTGGPVELTTTSSSTSSTTPPTTPPGTDPADATEHLLALATAIEEADVAADIAALEALGTRFTGTSGNDEAQAWLRAELEGLGLTVESDPFTSSQGPAANLVARKPGTVEPDKVWIFSAHYDSTSTSPLTAAPGADDNASGVASVLAAARTLTAQEHQQSIWFVFTGAEEQGSEGSEHMAGWLVAQSVDVQGVIAPDMIGYWPLGDDDLFDILGDDGSAHLASGMAAVAEVLGVPHKVWIEHSYCYGDDHTNFQESGMPAVSPMDCVEAHNIAASGEHTPHYHQTTDTSDTLYLPFTTEVVRVLVGSISLWAVPVEG